MIKNDKIYEIVDIWVSMTLCIIYKLTNIVNGKVYVGQTWSTMFHRLGQHLTSTKCVKLYNALRKYGKEKFTMECLTVAGTQETADYWEAQFIAEFDSIRRGYNIRGGGSRGRVSEDTKKKLSIANAGKKRTREQKLRISIAHKDQIGPNKGKSVPLSHGAGTPKGTKPWNAGTKGIVVAHNKGIRGNKRALSPEQERDIRSDNRSSRLLAKEYGVSKSHILNVRKRKPQIKETE